MNEVNKEDMDQSLDLVNKIDKNMPAISKAISRIKINNTNDYIKSCKIITIPNYYYLMRVRIAKVVNIIQIETKQMD